MPPMRSLAQHRMLAPLACVCLLGVLLPLTLSAEPSSAQVQQPTDSSAQSGTNATATASTSMLALNDAKTPIYAQGLSQFQQAILDKHPVLIALFTGAGGDMTLYRPGKEPIVADPPPLAYQYAKSAGHSAMAMYPLVVPFLNSPEDRSWIEPMQGYLERTETALQNLPNLDVSDANRKILQSILEGNAAFMWTALEQERVTLEELEAFTAQFRPLVEDAIGIAANAQVAHWMKVLDGWKAMLGDDWDDLLAATNTIYVTRQNNILFTILAQYMGRDAVNRQLLLFETLGFSTTKEALLSSLTRIVADRSLGELYFGDPYLMDYELLGSGARRAIIEQCQQRGMDPILPTLAPFNSVEWPWRTDPNSGNGPSTLEQVLEEVPQNGL